MFNNSNNWYIHGHPLDQLRKLNSSVAGVLHPLLSSLVKDDVNFREVLKGHVELALKAKNEKFLNKTTHTLADEMFNQFVENYKEKRGEL